MLESTEILIAKQGYGTLTILNMPEPLTIKSNINCDKLIIQGRAIFKGEVKVQHCEILKSLRPTLTSPENGFHTSDTVNLMGIVEFQGGFYCEDVTVV